MYLVQNVVGDMNSMNGTIYYDSSTSTYSIKLGEIDCMNGVACGYFNDTLNITGWGILEVKTTKQSSAKNVNDVNRMYAAGYLEGTVWHKRFWNAYYQIYTNQLYCFIGYLTSYQIANAYQCGWDGEKQDLGDYQHQITNWTQTQAVWIKDQIKNNR